MTRPSNISGVVLDIDWENMVDINLPTVKVTRKMKFGNKVIENREDEMGEMMFLGDMHIGHKSHSGNPFHAHLKFLQDHPHIRIGLMGDYIDYSTNTNFVKEEEIDVDEQINEFVRMMRPLKDRIVFALWGNHEERFAKYTKSNRLLKSMMLEVGVPDHCYVGEPQRGVFCSVISGDKTYGMYAQHGSTRAIANDFYQQKKTALSNRVSLICQGHTHKLGYTQATERSMEDTENQISKVTRRRWFVNTGCFIKDAGYTEAKSYPLTVVGAPLVQFYKSKDKIDVTDLSQEYKDYLTKGGIAFGDMSYNLDPWKFWNGAGRHDPLYEDRVPTLRPSSGLPVREGNGKPLPPR